MDWYGTEVIVKPPWSDCDTDLSQWRCPNREFSQVIPLIPLASCAPASHKPKEAAARSSCVAVELAGHLLRSDCCCGGVLLTNENEFVRFRESERKAQLILR